VISLKFYVGSENYRKKILSVGPGGVVELFKGINKEKVEKFAKTLQNCF
jgi:hypothetical protein